MCFLPCCAAGAVGAAWAANKASNSLDKAFAPKPEPTEPAFVTELKLFSGITSPPAEQEVSKGYERRARPISKKEAESKARLQRLVEENKGGSRR